MFENLSYCRTLEERNGVGGAFFKSQFIYKVYAKLQSI